MRNENKDDGGGVGLPNISICGERFPRDMGKNVRTRAFHIYSWALMGFTGALQLSLFQWVYIHTNVVTIES